MMDYPPRPDHPQEVLKVTEAFSSVIQGRQALYVSSPITTGKRLIEWLGSTSEQTGNDEARIEGLREAVIEPNRDDARTFVSELRESRTEVVIDPAGLGDLEQWTQADYRSLWADVIDRYVRLVIFRQGWEYSDGCTYEFAVAVRSGIAMALQDLSPLNREAGAELIRDAIKSRSAMGDSLDFARAVLNAVQLKDSESGTGTLR